MKIKRCVLNGHAVDSMESFYSEIAGQLPFPKYFGRNLDALWDVLTVDVEGPIEIIWNESQYSRGKMGKEFEKLFALLKEVEKERKDFKIVLK
jgi:ribonuclease inhibitor